MTTFSHSKKNFHVVMITIPMLSSYPNSRISWLWSLQYLFYGLNTPLRIAKIVFRVISKPYSNRGSLHVNNMTLCSNRSLTAAWPQPNSSLTATWPQPDRSLTATSPQPDHSSAYILTIVTLWLGHYSTLISGPTLLTLLWRVWNVILLHSALSVKWFAYSF